MLIRELRGSWAASMATVKEIEPTRQAVCDWFHEWWIGAPIPAEEFRVSKYGPTDIDSRTGWHTHVILVAELGVVGFTDGPLS